MGAKKVSDNKLQASPDVMPTKLIYKKQVQLRLGVSASTVDRILRAGRLRYYKIGSRVACSEQFLAEYLDSCEQRKAA